MSGSGKFPSIKVNKVISMIDSSIDIRIIDLNPHQEIEIRAKRISYGIKQYYLGSYAKFRANAEGMVNLAEQEPLSGTYSGVDGMGLFWSLEVMGEIYDIGPNEINHPLSPQTVTLTLLIDNKVVDEITITRQWQAEHITRKPVREDGLVGTFFYEENTNPKLGIIVLGGSEGGIYEYPATLLAAHGYSVLALAYFGVENLPVNCVNIPLEYIEIAINWMKNQDKVANGWLGIHGTSKGAELALLSASLFSEIRSVVALNGFAVAFSGIVPWSDKDELPPAWLYNNEPLPYLSPKNPIDVALKCMKMWNERKGNPFGEWYAALASNPVEVKKAEIPVEKINGSILLITGKEDDVDTTGLSKIAIDRLKKFNCTNEYEHIVYPGAGHSIGIPNIIQSYNQGNKYDTNNASKDSWLKTIDFYKQSYKNANLYK
ncbi:acyl-CoA thioesterase/bile acid-CoA:amino acid N-acyltransferase family protein [Solibacillus sp. FSL W8-0474]|uniref:acyl-CoA thioesterase/bile acid-CoA:amino acid N-acyltransferase family protein n=1 Tax=Solibacillus sp. FSL W8-0474 TaxID=2975336 RepID=UPI0030F81CA9